MPPAGPAQVYSEREFARLANEAALAHLRAICSEREFRTLLAARTAVVRFRASANSVDPPGRRHEWGSGVLVNGGRHVLVAGHALDANRGRAEPELTAITVEGDVLRCRSPAVRGGVDGAPEGDWGLAELEGPLPEGCSSLEMAAAAPDATVVMLGFSGCFGLHPDGQVYWSDQLEEAPLLPLAFVGTTNATGRGEIRVVAGARPKGGSSGGAIVDREGRLVAVMTDSHHRWSTGHAFKRKPESELEPRSRVNVEESASFSGTPVEVFREWVEARWTR